MTRTNKILLAATAIAVVSVPAYAQMRRNIRIVGSSTVYPFTKAVAEQGDKPDPIEIDVSAGWWDRLLQDIVKRSVTLDYVSVVMVFTCAKMLYDGLGGLTILITASQIRCKSLDDVLMDFVADAEEHGEIKAIK